MTAIDPYSTYADAIGAPYANAFSILPDDLLTGDIELPFVSSALWFPTAGRVKVTALGGQTIYVQSTGPAVIPIRVTKVHALDDPEQDIGWLPGPILALW